MVGKERNDSCRYTRAGGISPKSSREAHARVQGSVLPLDPCALLSAVYEKKCRLKNFIYVKKKRAEKVYSELSEQSSEKSIGVIGMNLSGNSYSL